VRYVQSNLRISVLQKAIESNLDISPLKLSIIIPTYNRVSLLLETINSIVTGLNFKYEILICDDGSSDGTASFCRTLAANGRKVVHLPSFRQLGAQAARNRGIREARGDFLMFVDSDDVLVPAGVLEVLERLGSKPELDYAFGKVLMTDEWLKPLAGKGPIGAGFEDSPVEVAGYHWHTMGPIYRRRCIDKVGGWNLELTGSQDWEYQARVKLFGGRGEFVDALVGYWRQHTGGRVGTRSFRPDYVRSVMKACESIHQHAMSAGQCDAALERRLAKKLIVHAIEWGANGYRDDKWKCLNLALGLAPQNPFLKLAILIFRISPRPLDSQILNKLYPSPC
jgi:glycosyltransferase involved in cell wall biosynthesis